MGGAQSGCNAQNDNLPHYTLPPEQAVEIQYNGMPFFELPFKRQLKLLFEKDSDVYRRAYKPKIVEPSMLNNPLEGFQSVKTVPVNVLYPGFGAALVVRARKLLMRGKYFDFYVVRKLHPIGIVSHEPFANVLLYEVPVCWCIHLECAVAHISKTGDSAVIYTKDTTSMQLTFNQFIYATDKDIPGIQTAKKILEVQYPAIMEPLLGMFPVDPPPINIPADPHKQSTLLWGQMVTQMTRDEPNENQDHINHGGSPLPVQDSNARIGISIAIKSCPIIDVFSYAPQK